MNVTTGTAPVRFFVCDDFVHPRPDWQVPGTDAPVWEAIYDNDCERLKRTTRSLCGWAANVARQMQELDTLRTCAQLFGVPAYPDALMWGGGLQVIAPGGYLAPHLDGVRHPKRPNLRRAVQLVCFCHPTWSESDGGYLEFFAPSGEVAHRLAPLPGRLVAFENTDLAVHGVSRVTGPNDRVTVALSLLADAREQDVREKAMFWPSRTNNTSRITNGTIEN